MAFGLFFLTFLMKSFSAKLAHERLIPRVDARVRVESGAAVEGLPALITLVRFFLEKKNPTRRTDVITSDRNPGENNDVTVTQFYCCFYCRQDLNNQPDVGHFRCEERFCVASQ